MIHEVGRVHVLASGSKGNATLIVFDKKIFLIDAGISAKRLVESMQQVGVQPEQVEGIFITHEHADHINGLPQFLKRFHTPVYTKKRTWQALGERVTDYNHLFTPLTRHSLQFGSVMMEQFPLSHDAADPVGYTFYKGNEKITYITDTGILDDRILSYMDDSTKLVLEANYDQELLRIGPYPLSLKKRVAGPYGHLSNEAAMKGLLMMKRRPQLQLILAHRSEQNNSIGHVERALKEEFIKAGLEWQDAVSFQHGQPKEVVSL